MQQRSQRFSGSLRTQMVRKPAPPPPPPAGSIPTTFATKIKDGLFIGNAEAAQDPGFLFSNKISHVINCSGQSVANRWESFGIRYLTYMWHDVDSSLIIDSKDKTLNEVFYFIEEAFNASHSVLIHSVRGTSRSVAVLVAYLMRKYWWSLESALEFVCAKRREAAPKPGFLRQLRNLERRMVKDQQAGNAPSKDDDTVRDEIIIQNTMANSCIADEPLASERGPKGSARSDEEARRGLTWRLPLVAGPGSTSANGSGATVSFGDGSDGTAVPVHSAGGSRSTVKPILRKPSWLAPDTGIGSSQPEGGKRRAGDSASEAPAGPQSGRTAAAQAQAEAHAQAVAFAQQQSQANAQQANGANAQQANGATAHSQQYSHTPPQGQNQPQQPRATAGSSGSAPTGLTSTSHPQAQPARYGASALVSSHDSPSQIASSTTLAAGAHASAAAQKHTAPAPTSPPTGRDHHAPAPGLQENSTQPPPPPSRFRETGPLPNGETEGKRHTSVPPLPVKPKARAWGEETTVSIATKPESELDATRTSGAGARQTWGLADSAGARAGPSSAAAVPNGARPDDPTVNRVLRPGSARVSKGAVGQGWANNGTGMRIRPGSSGPGPRPQTADNRVTRRGVDELSPGRAMSAPHVLRASSAHTHGSVHSEATGGPGPGGADGGANNGVSMAWDEDQSISIDTLPSQLTVQDASLAEDPRSIRMGGPVHGPSSTPGMPLPRRVLYTPASGGAVGGVSSMSGVPGTHPSSGRWAGSAKSRGGTSGVTGGGPGAATTGARSRLVFRSGSHPGGVGGGSITGGVQSSSAGTAVEDGPAHANGHTHTHPHTHGLGHSEPQQSGYSLYGAVYGSGSGGGGGSGPSGGGSQHDESHLPTYMRSTVRSRVLAHRNAAQSSQPSALNSTYPGPHAQQGGWAESDTGVKRQPALLSYGAVKGKRASSAHSKPDDRPRSESAPPTSVSSTVNVNVNVIGPAAATVNVNGFSSSSNYYSQLHQYGSVPQKRATSAYARQTRHPPLSSKYGTSHGGPSTSSSSGVSFPSTRAKYGMQSRQMSWTR